MYFDKKNTHLGPQDLADRGPYTCISKNANRIPKYHQARLGAFIQKSLGVLTTLYKSQIQHFFVEMEGYGPSNDIKFTDI